MKEINSYPKVHALGHRRIHDILDGKIVVEEKIDGSQFSFANIGGELKIRSKGAMLYADNPEKMFKLGIDVVVDLHNKEHLKEGLVFRGEYLKTPKHNTLVYDRTPANHIMIFDIQDADGNCIPYNEKADIATQLGLEVVPSFNVNISKSDDIIKLLETDSVLGGQKIEGIVIKNYEKWTDDGKFMAGKYVSEAFKEKHEKSWGETNKTGKDVIQDIIMDLKTDARWNKAIQHLKEKGEYTESPKDIGNLLKEIHTDIDEEEDDYIKTRLYKHFIGNIKRGVCGGFPEYFKQYLLKNMDKEATR